MSTTSPEARGDRWLLARESSPSHKVSIRPVVLFPILLFILSFAINLDHVKTTEFHPDETRWVNRAHYFTDLLDPFGPTWQDQYLTRGQPPLGSYLMGLGLVLQGRDTETNAVWDFAYGTDWNRMNGAMPSDGDLDAARRMNAFVGAVTVVLTFLVAQAISGTVAAAVAGLLLALHPLHIWISSQALSDQLFVMLVAMALLTIIKLAEKPTRARAVILGMLLGLGGATKLTPLLLSFPLAIYGVALLMLARLGYVHRHRAFQLGPMLIIQPIIAIATFVLSYPYLWPAPVTRTWNLFKLRTEEMAEQSAAWPEVTVDHPLDALVRVYDRLTWEFSTTGNVAETAVGWFAGPTEIWGFDLVLTVVGIVALTRLTLKRGLTSGTALAAYLLAGQTSAILVGMRVDFYRYHLPIVLASMILCGLGVQMLWQVLADRGAWRVWNVIPGITVTPEGAWLGKVAPEQPHGAHVTGDPDATGNSTLQTGIR